MVVSPVKFVRPMRPLCFMRTGGRRSKWKLPWTAGRVSGISLPSLTRKRSQTGRAAGRFGWGIDAEPDQRGRCHVGEHVMQKRLYQFLPLLILLGGVTAAGLAQTPLPDESGTPANSAKPGTLMS